MPVAGDMPLKNNAYAQLQKKYCFKKMSNCHLFPPGTCELD